ncbi:hypothetical protein DE146DRAFT_791395 [Phaeosphaeria sp. MPI-PUGE-AT-0046c]|nr:hypothetical protein DE146DRAFT_791395 [Phaeosphaeria sp. MPI-PUGE-AT-0046c]
MAAKTGPGPRVSEITASDTIVVRVGTEAKKYTLHKRLLVHHFDYFKGALSGKFRETDDGVVPLDDVETDIFDAFVDWMYERNLPDYLFTWTGKLGAIPTKYRAYTLADRLMATSFKRALFDTIFEEYAAQKRHTAYHVITFAYKNLSTSDPMLQLLVDAFCANSTLENYSEKWEPTRFIPDMPHEAFIRLFLKMNEMRGLTEVDKSKTLKRDAYDS